MRYAMVEMCCQYCLLFVERYEFGRINDKITE